MAHPAYTIKCNKFKKKFKHLMTLLLIFRLHSSYSSILSFSLIRWQQHDDKQSTRAIEKWKRRKEIVEKREKREETGRMWNSRKKKKTIYSPMSAVLKTNRSEYSLHPYRFLLCIFAYTFIIHYYYWYYYNLSLRFIFFFVAQEVFRLFGESMKNRWREKLEVINQVIISKANRTKMMILYQFAVIHQEMKLKWMNWIEEMEGIWKMD